RPPRARSGCRSPTPAPSYGSPPAKRLPQEAMGAAKAILFVAGVGQDGSETPRTFLDEEGFLPILIQYLQPLGRDPTGGLAGPGGDRMGRADRGSPARPEGAVGARDEGGDLLSLCG